MPGSLAVQDLFYFEHYPVSPDELVSQAAALTRAGTTADLVVSGVQVETDRALLSVEGQLEGPLAEAPQLALSTGAEVAAGGRFCAGCLLYFAEAIITYDAGIEGLNQQVADAVLNQIGLPLAQQRTVPELANTPQMQHDKMVLDTALDARADKTAAMLDRGPNEADVATLTAAEVMPSAQARDEAWVSIGQQPNAQAVLDGTADPVLAAEFWASLTVVQRATLMQDRPDLVGRINGFPVEARDEANRRLLDQEIAELTALEQRGMLTADEQRRLDNARATQQALDDAERTVDPITGQPVTAQLMIYESGAFGGDGRGAISVGDADTADNVAVFVPGIRTTMTSMPGYVVDGLALYGASREAAPSETTAVVVWIGYDAPYFEPEHLAADVVLGVLEQEPWYEEAVDTHVEPTVTPDLADQGGQLLAYDMAGLEASRGADGCVLTVIGHSYGATTVAYAAADHGMRPDQIILLGSPGMGSASTAADLQLPVDGRVYVASASSDPVTHTGDQGLVNRGAIGIGLGPDPAEVEVGAIRVGAEFPGGGYDLDDHMRYLEPGTESLDNVVGIVVNQNPVTLAEPREDTPDPRDWHWPPWDPGPTDPEWDREPLP